VSARPARPGVARRLACALYDLLICVALVVVATFPFILVFGDSTQGWRRHLLQSWLVAVIGTYFVAFWTHGGQTLPMKTWRLALVRAGDGGPVRLFQAVHRFLLAVLSTLALGLGFLWAFADRERQFLHDRLAGTKIVERGREAAAQLASRP
jgi:uncharacterized RDD family membrane protein YckC